MLSLTAVISVFYLGSASAQLSGNINNPNLPPLFLTGPSPQQQNGGLPQQQPFSTTHRPDPFSTLKPNSGVGPIGSNNDDRFFPDQQQPNRQQQPNNFLGPQTGNQFPGGRQPQNAQSFDQQQDFRNQNLGNNNNAFGQRFDQPPPSFGFGNRSSTQNQGSLSQIPSPQPDRNQFDRDRQPGVDQFDRDRQPGRDQFDRDRLNQNLPQLPGQQSNFGTNRYNDNKFNNDNRFGQDVPVDSRFLSTSSERYNPNLNQFGQGQGHDNRFPFASTSSTTGRYEGQNKYPGDFDRRPGFDQRPGQQQPGGRPYYPGLGRPIDEEDYRNIDVSVPEPYNEDNEKPEPKAIRGNDGGLVEFAGHQQGRPFNPYYNGAESVKMATFSIGILAVGLACVLARLA